MRKSAIIIVNPVSGRGEAGDKAERTRRILSRSGLDAVLFETGGPGHARSLAFEHADSCETLVGIGGDGTVNEIVNGVFDARSGTPIAVIPAGTANVVSRELAIPADLKAQATLAADSAVRRLDLGRAGERVFIMCAGAGIDGMVVDRISRLRGEQGITMAHYVRPLLKAIRQYSFSPMEVVVDGKTVDRESTFTVIGNMRQYGGPFRFFREASTEDGRLDVCCMRGKRTIDLLRHAAGAMTGCLGSFHDVAYYRGEEVTLRAEAPVPVQVDGDPHGALPMTFRVCPKAVSFCVPGKDGF